MGPSTYHVILTFHRGVGLELIICWQLQHILSGWVDSETTRLLSANSALEGIDWAPTAHSALDWGKGMRMPPCSDAGTEDAWLDTGTDIILQNGFFRKCKILKFKVQSLNLSGNRLQNIILRNLTVIPLSINFKLISFLISQTLLYTLI